jgi:hypothetical protein
MIARMNRRGWFWWMNCPSLVLAPRERGGVQAISDFLYQLRNMSQKYRRARWLYTVSKKTLASCAKPIHFNTLHASANCCGR